MNCLLVRLILWLVVSALFPLSVTGTVLSFKLEVLRVTTFPALPPERHLDLAERVLARLEAAEQKESDLWLRDDIRIAWITVLEASRGNPQPHIDATYKVLGIHPDKVWPAICARRAAILGSSEIPSAALPDLGAAYGLSADLGTQLRQNIDGKNGQVTGSAQRAQLRCGRKSDKLGRAEEASGSLALSPKKPSESVRNLAQEGVA
jgi:hypothetical protein